MFGFAVLFVLTGALLGISAQVWFTVLGFRKNLLWGLIFLLGLVFPFVRQFLPSSSPIVPMVLAITGGVGLVAALVFLIIEWSEAKNPFFLWLTSIGFCIAGIILLSQALAADQGPSAAGRRFAQRSRASQFMADLEDRLQKTSPEIAPYVRSLSKKLPTFRTGGEEEPEQQKKFVSKIPARPADLPPGAPERTPAGVYYSLERVSTTTPNGVKAIRPGEEVRLRDRLPDGRMQVFFGKDTFTVRPSQLTDDLDVAREAERRDFIQRGGRLETPLGYSTNR